MKTKKSAEQSLPASTDEVEVLRRMLHTPPKPHKAKGETSAKKAKPREKK